MDDTKDFTTGAAKAGPDQHGISRFKRGDSPGRICPQMPRSRDQIDPALRELMGRILGGLAPMPLVLQGPPGTGKTSAACCFADAVRTAKFVPFVDLLNIAFAPWQDQQEFWRDVGRTELLILDDLLPGSESAAAFRSETVLKLLSIREQKANRRVIVTSNCTRELLAAYYGEAVESRLFCGSVFELFGADRRLATSDGEAAA